MTKQEATNYVKENMEGTFYLTDRNGLTDGELFNANAVLEIIADQSEDEWNNAGVVLY